MAAFTWFLGRFAGTPSSTLRTGRVRAEGDQWPLTPHETSACTYDGGVCWHQTTDHRKINGLYV